MPRKHKEHTTSHSPDLESENRFWKPQYTAKKENLGVVKVYRAGTDGQFRDDKGNLMDGAVKEEGMAVKGR